jgi:hypothetical protein
MAYRLYFLNKDQHISDVVEIESPNDEIAALMAEQHAAGRPIELWHRDRMALRKLSSTLPDRKEEPGR